MAVEEKRGCGYRKVGGLYLVSDGPGMTCHRLPMNMHSCPVCSEGIKYSRAFKWIDAQKLFGRCDELHIDHDCHKFGCKVCAPPEGRHGLLWVGAKFYTPDKFIEESKKLGISKRIGAIPRGFKLGETVIYLAHIEAGVERKTENSDLIEKRAPAVFYMFKPVRVEKIITEEMSKDPIEMDKLEKSGITPVIVPNDDMDHQGTVHDKPEE